MSVSDAQFKRLCERTVKKLRKLAPYDTGNLSLNAIKVEYPSPNVCLIYVDESIAPYMPFTTRPWVSPRWHGKKNPNEGWWQRAGEYVVDYVAKQLDGEVENGQNNNVK